jgi:hypothetical protein
VTGITRELHKPLSITEFDINSNKWIKKSTDMVGQTLYDDYESGITLYVLEGNVYRIRYRPTLEKYKHLRCPTCPTSPTNTATERYGSVWLNGYGDVSFEEETRWLDKFAVKLKERENDLRGYIVVYGGCRDRKDEVQKRADRAKAYLVTTYGIQNEDITIIHAGQRRSFEDPTQMNVRVGRRKFIPAEDRRIPATMADRTAVQMWLRRRASPPVPTRSHPQTRPHRRSRRRC